MNKYQALRKLVELEAQEEKEIKKRIEADIKPKP